jgi:hypothetical protein
MRLLLLISWTCISLLLPAVASAEALVICHVGGPGSTAQAKPVLDKFLRHVEQAGGLAAGSMTGEYHTTLAGCLAYIKSNKPLFGVFDLATYLAQQRELKLKPLACMGKPRSQRYHLLVRKGSYKDLAALKGKTLISSHVGDLAFVSKVIFDGKIDAASHFNVASTRLPLKGIRKVARNKADATLVDSLAYEHLGELKLPATLESIYASPGLPGLTLAVLGVAKQSGVVQKMTRALPRLCTGEGKSMCKTFQVTAFTKVTPAGYRALERKYNAK